MPHFIVEYTANIEQEMQLDVLFQRVHALLIGLELFPTGGIRSRAHRVDSYRFADGAKDYAGIHIELLLSSARPFEVRRRIGEDLFAVVETHFAPIHATRPLALSMHVGTLEQELFFNKNNLHALFEQPAGN